MIIIRESLEVIVTIAEEIKIGIPRRSGRNSSLLVHKHRMTVINHRKAAPKGENPLFHRQFSAVKKIVSIGRIQRACRPEQIVRIIPVMPGRIGAVPADPDPEPALLKRPTVIMKLRLLCDDLDLIFRFLHRKLRDRKQTIHNDLRHLIVKTSALRILQPEELRCENRNPVMVSLYHCVRV